MSIFDIFNNNKITELEKQLEQLQEKSSLNDGLAGIVNDQLIFLNTKSKGNSYDSHYTIHRGVDMLADSIAQLPLQIYKGDELMPNDVVLGNGFNMHQPHPKLSLNELMYTCCVYFFYRGEFMIYINSDQGRITLEPVNPKLMVRRNGKWKWNNKKTIEDDELIYAKLFNPDGDRGLSPVDVVKADILNDLSASDYSTKFFKQFAQVGGTLRDEEGRAGPEDMKRLVSQFNQAHAGGENAHKVVGLPKGIRYEEAKQTMREMQFLESRKDIRDKILAVLGIHKALFGITDQVNRAVSEEATRQLWIYTLKPKAIRIQEKINQTLFTQYFPGYKCKSDFSAIDALKEGLETVLKQANQYRSLGYTTNEINEHFDLGMEEITDSIGDMRLIPNNMIPADDLILEPLIDEGKTKTTTDSIDKIIDIIEDEETKLVSSYKRKYTRLQRAAEKEFARKMSKYFSVQLGKVIRVVKENKSIGKDYNSLLADIQNTIYGDKERLSKLIAPIYSTISEKADALAIATVKADAQAVAETRIVNRMTNKIANINNHTYRLIRTQVKVGIDADESIDDVAKRITKVYKFNSSRTRTIAKTETNNIINRTLDSRYKTVGIEQKQWLSYGDSSTRETHSHNDGEGTVPYNHVYSNGMQYPGDPSGSAGDIVNCRCMIIAMTK